ncbi:unnamed protein product [Pocillopora meandrina]|uniref:Basement membrane-specific heparan sulfate proteoglycan core protein n=1 Tax=Pocillopora meandrina TaxID=46732 RepID=A0AAU9XBU6_9CNID|nr:unnamed protein product [Pocillopora meandrina]
MKLSQTGKYSYTRRSIKGCSSYGPTFGGGYDIRIASFASSNSNSDSNLGYTYRPPFGFPYLDSSTHSFLAGIIRDHKRERRNVAAGTITLQQVRQEINNKLNQSCSVNNKICQTGPPGPPGARSSRCQGATGKTGSRGPSGPIGAPGVSGKRGPVGPQGVKGDKGDKGSVGAHGMRGETGTKGQCVVPLKISVYPVSQEVFVNEPVIFYCWVQGHLSSKITWRKLGGTLSNATVEDGALRISSVQRSHAGSYMCTAHTGLGMFRILSRLHVKEPPKFTNKPPTVVNILLGSNVTLCCKASGSPRPNVEWFQAQKSSVSLPVFQEDGCLLIKMVKEDVDFICRAKNSFGLAETSTTVIAEILRGLEQSVILTNNIHYLRTLSFWLGSVVQSQSSYWKRCWRASVDGWASTTFHSKCDNKGPTATIIRVGKYIFGGYTSTSWAVPGIYAITSSTIEKGLTQKGVENLFNSFSFYFCDSFFPFCLLDSNCGYLYSSKAFLFSLVNKPAWAPVKLSQTGQYSSGRYSIRSCSRDGPTFGGGHDIHITNYASSNTKSYTNLGYTYSPPSGHSPGSSFTKSFLAGSYYFQPDEVEVFYESTK